MVVSTWKPYIYEIQASDMKNNNKMEGQANQTVEHKKKFRFFQTK